MRFSSGAWLLLTAALRSAHAQQDATCDAKTPFVSPKLIQNGLVIEPSEGTDMSDVIGCCASEAGGKLVPQVIGRMPQMNTDETMQIVDAAKQAWNGGSGTWPQLPLSERIAAVERFLTELKKERESIVELLMWEIGKNYKDAASEFDRTVQFAEQVIEVVRTDEEFLGAPPGSALAPLVPLCVERPLVSYSVWAHITTH